MTTTAHEDQFTVGTQTIELVRQPYDTVAILRRNIADAKKEMQRQAERAESYADAMRSLASYVGAGGYNADTVDAGVFEEKIRWGIGEIMARMERAEAELAKLAQQKPVAWMDAEGDTYKEEPPENWCPPHVPLYASFAHAMHKGATHCDDCGLTWLDDGLNPLGCPYCKDAVPEPAVPNEIPLGKGEFVIWPVKIGGVHGLAFVKTNAPKAVGASHAEPEDGQIELGAGDSVIHFGNAESAMVLAERLQYVIALLQPAEVTK